MFLSHEKSPSKMKFQKPNILRKRTKTVDKTQSELNVNHITVASLNSKSDKQFKHKCGKPVHHSKRPTQRITLESHGTEENTTDSNTVGDLIDATVVKTFRGGVVPHTVQLSATENKQIFNNTEIQDCLYNVKKEDIIDECESLMSGDSGKWLMNQVKSKNNNNMIPYNTIVVIEKKSLSVPDSMKESPAIIELITVDTSQYTCDAPECKKTFISEKKLKKHKAIHKKNLLKTTAQSFECPAHLPGSDPAGSAGSAGSEPAGSDPQSESDEPARQPCARLFSSRQELLKHLKEDHTLDDAAYRCSGCARRFFRAAGERTHARACAAARRALDCPWGCGRQFLQPCRLREHARAHTGDRPYPCTHPNCGWSFRTASKLERHARRHRGERRHVCGACGRGFLRREHLREHAARHARAAAAAAADTHETALPAEPAALLTLPAPASAPRPPTPLATLDLHAELADTLHIELVSSPHTELLGPPHTELLGPPHTELLGPPHTELLGQPHTEPAGSPLEQPALAEALLVEPSDCAAEPDWRIEQFLSRAARTHCPWPLAHHAVAQVEVSEGESEVCTIKSDLFLHGNILHNEDSGSGPAAAGDSQAEAAAEALHDDGLGLFDAHSTIDFMQEELLYTEATDAQFEVDISAYYSQLGIRR